MLPAAAIGAIPALLAAPLTDDISVLCALAAKVFSYPAVILINTSANA